MQLTNLNNVIPYLELKHYGTVQRIDVIQLWFNKIQHLVA